MEEKLSKKEVRSIRFLPRRSNWTKISPHQQTLPDPHSAKEELGSHLISKRCP